MFDINVNLFSTVLAAGTSAFLGSIVYLEDRKNVTHIIFSILCSVFAVWSVINYALLIVSEDSLLFWVRILIILTPPQVILLLFFVQQFPKKTIKVHGRYIGAMVLLVFLMMIITVSPSFIVNVTIVDGKLSPVTGALMPVFLILLGLYSLLTFGMVIRRFQNAEYTVKKQWFTMGTGFVTAYGLLIFLIILRVFAFSDTTYVTHAPLFILPVLLGVGYAILKKNLFNLRVIITQIVVFLVIVASFIEVFLSDQTVNFTVSMIMAGFIMLFAVLLIRSVISEVSQLEKLEEITLKLREADRMKSQFLSFASHQVKSPMTVVKGYAQLMVEGKYGVLPDKAKETSEKIRDAADRLIDLVNNLLDIRKLEAGKVSYDFTDVDLSALLEGSFESLRPLAEDKHLKYTFKGLPGNRIIKGDKSKLEQIFQNLLDNAIKYTSEGSVTLELEDNNPFYDITVSDSGKGISPEMSEKLFEQFSRAEDERVKGTGLGLYIAKHFVEAHKGTIRVSSLGKDKGTSFIVSIPKHLEE